MLDCHACSWRLLRAICRGGPLAPVSHLKPPNRALKTRAYHVSTQDGQPPMQDAFFDTPGSRKRQEQNQGRGPETSGLVLQNSNPSFDLERSSAHNHLKRELPWLKDPSKLLERVIALLDQGNQFKALELVRMASREGQVAICWNRIIQHLLLLGRATEALKVYNEMKKRAQIPDAFTYSIILRGLSETKSFDTVPTAVSILNSMTGPNSRVRPGIIHTNSALRVCARKGDLDAMWAIASTIPDDGPQKANAITYTTILNALRVSAEKQPRNLRPNQLVIEIQDQVVLQARQIWEDVASRWYQGKILIDETLICTMGRILLMGSRSQDWDDVFSLVEQTTNIWRQAPHLRTGAKTDFKGKSIPPPLSQLARTPIGDEGPDAGGEFDNVPQSLSFERATLRRSKSASLQYVKPSTNTLSMLLDASLRLYLKNAADEYWKIFTNPLGLAVQPDDDNYHAYLRILRQARASSQAVKLIRGMKDCEPH
ncbi:mitochondrialpentatricopeptide repeat-containing protein 2, partial [Venturia nashicola]